MEQIFQFFRKKKGGMGRRPRNIRHRRNQNLEAGILLSLQIKFDIPSTFLFIPFCTLLLLLPSSSFPPFYTNHFNLCELQTVLWYSTIQKRTWTFQTLSDVSDFKELESVWTKHFKLGVKPFRTFTSATKILSVLYDLKTPYVETTFVRLWSSSSV